MGQTSSNARSLPSTDIQRDAEILVQLFKGKLRVEEVQQEEEQSNNENFAVLLHEDEGCVILVAQENPATTITISTWVADVGFVEAALRSMGSLVERDVVAGHKVALLQLSATKLFLLPRDLVASPAGRRTLAQRLCQIKTVSKPTDEEEEESAPAKIQTSEEETQAETASSPPSEAEAEATITSRDQPIVPDEQEGRIPPKLSMLDVKLLEQNDVMKEGFQLNTTVAQDFENDLFKGKILFLVKPPKPEDDPYWSEKIFSKKKRMFVLQLQGRFKRKPQGMLYVGGEITKPVRVGLLTRGVMGMLLRFLDSFVSDSVSSFGDKEGLENPRVVIPAHWAFNRLARTPQGEEPPPITHEPFPESDEDQKKRSKAKTYDWNTSDTFSATFFSMYFNFVDWKMANTPGGGMDLANFWGSAALRIVMYENTGNKKAHLQKDNLYYFSIQLDHVGGSDNQENENNADIQNDITMLRRTSELLQQREQAPPPEKSLMQHSESMLFADIPNIDLLSDDEYYDAAAEESFEDHTDADAEDESLNASSALPSGSPKEGISLATIDAKTPAWVELPGGGKGGCYTTFFAVNVGSKTFLRSKADCERFIETTCLQGQASTFVTSSYTSRLSPFERNRRMLGYVLSISDPVTEKYIPAGESGSGESFLQRPFPSVAERDGSSELLSGFVARALSDRHWVEEWATVERNGLISFRRTDRKRCSCRLAVSSILSINVLRSEECPLFQGYSFLCIETFGRSLYLMFSTTSQRDSWHLTLLELMASGKGSNDRLPDHRTMNLDGSALEFMHTSSMWECKKRRIFNCASFVLRSGVEPMKKPSDVNQLVQKTLMLSVEAANEELVSKRHEFFKSAARLKLVELDQLSEKEKLAFFLNLYHTMVMHAFLVLGPPSTSLRFISLFKEFAYEVSDDIISLAGLEHCVIRSSMSQPSNFLSRFVIPKSRYWFALRTLDFRINFALNSGSKSTPEQIIVYAPDRLEEQLDMAARMCLRTASVTRQGGRDLILTLPRVCQWFEQDFGGKPEHVVGKVAPFLQEEERLKLSAVWLPEKNVHDMSHVSVRYEDFAFVCRFLSLEQGHAPDERISGD